MRTNLPVTQRAYQFPQNETLLSTIDTSSHISSANAACIRTSGFPSEELMGQAHYLMWSLASRFSAAAKEIKGLIDDSVKKVESGSSFQVADVGQTMTEVVTQVKSVNDLMAEITVAISSLSERAQRLVNAVKVFPT